jgi:UDP-hydrolysing UDP-N-acetyl-D-glucosamine 2-epimerase
LVTFHPVTLEDRTAAREFGELLAALTGFPQMQIIFTKANADTCGRIINQMIDRYVREQPERCRSFTSMGRQNYLSAMRYCRAVVGNSSSGIIEAPSFHIPTINIGDRQQGRLQADSVINCRPVADDISRALRLAFTADFRAGLQEVHNPYEKSDTSQQIIKIIKEIDLTDILKKEFYDIPLPSSA